MQAILTAFNNSISDEDDVISQRELNRFIIRLKGFGNFNEESFRLAFKKSANKTPDDLLELTESYLSSKSGEHADQKDGALV